MNTSILATKILQKYNNKTSRFEFKKIGKILGQNNSKNVVLADIGSGLCHFLDYVNTEYTNIECHSVDINQDLVNIALEKGYKSVLGNILELPFPDSSFDYVHCSHVIEHLKYPDVINAIDELFRITKKNGCVILRSPLVLNHRFYNDIDHIRPYPPDAILNYFNNPQQQITGKYKIKEVSRWYTRIAYEFNYYRYTGKWVKPLNFLLKLCWSFINFPKAKPNNYGIIFRKL